MLRPVLLDLVGLYDDLTQVLEAAGSAPEETTHLEFFRDSVEQDPGTQTARSRLSSTVRISIAPTRRSFRLPRRRIRVSIAGAPVVASTDGSLDPRLAEGVCLEWSSTGLQPGTVYAGRLVEWPIGELGVSVCSSEGVHCAVRSDDTSAATEEPTLSYRAVRSIDRVFPLAIARRERVCYVLGSIRATCRGAWSSKFRHSPRREEPARREVGGFPLCPLRRSSPPL